MSLSTVIIVQLLFILLILSVVFALIIRKFRHKINEKERQVGRLKRQLEVFQEQAHRRQTAVLRQGEGGAADVATTAEDVEKADLGTVLNDMSSDLDTDSKNLTHLDEMIAAQAATMKRIRKMREALDGKSESSKQQGDSAELKRELKAAQLQNEQSAQVINGLQASLERSRIRIKKVEREMSRSKSGMQRIPELEKNNKRLEHDNANLKRKVSLEMANHQATIERIQSQLNAAERKNHKYAEEAMARERSLLTTINELQEKLQEAGAGADPELVASLESALSSAQQELELALREKSFIESHFVELEKALEESAAAQQELDRTRKEYEMLEQHFLEMEKAAQQSPDAAKNPVEREVIEDPAELDPLDVGAELAAAAAAEEHEPKAGASE